MPMLVSRRSSRSAGATTTRPPFAVLPCLAHQTHDYEATFNRALNRPHEEQRYRVFADIERQRRRFPGRSGIPREGRARSCCGAPTIISA